MSESRLRLRVIAIGVVVIAAFVVETAYDGWRLHQQIMMANNRELGNLSRSLASEANRSLQEVDRLLDDTSGWLAKNPRQAPSVIDAGLAAMAARTPQVGTLVVVDADGRQTHRSRESSSPLADVSDRAYFRLQRDRADRGLYIEGPVVSRTEGTSALVLSRRVSGPGGRFAGIVAATVTLQQLREAYRAIDLGNSSTLLLTLADGTLVVRQPAIGGVEAYMRIPQLVEMRAGAPINRMISPIDGRQKLVAAVGVGTQPLILAVSRDEEAALKPWVDEMWSSSIRTVLLTLMTLLTIFGVLRQLRRLESASLSLRQSEHRYAMTMEAANEGHAEWNIAADTLFLSAKWRALHGLREFDAIPTPANLWALLTLHPDDERALKLAIRAHLDGHSDAIEADYRVRAAGEDWRWIHARGRCAREGAGRPLSLFCSAIDISDRKRAESDKADFESRREQTRRLEALGTLAGGIAHDFNNILGAILGFGEMAQQRAETGSRLRRHIDHVMQSGARARLLVRRILDFSRSGVTEHALVNVQGVVEEVVAMLSPSVPAGIVVTARLQAGDAAVMGDATQLHQVAMNLCANAVQAMGEMGQLEVTLERRTLDMPRSLLQGDLAAGAYVRLDVIDNGAGVAPDVLGRMFGIVSALGGAIDVAAREGGGTCVSVWLPVAGELAPQAVASAAGWPLGRGEVVMVVDDERALVELAEELLAGLGYEPVGYSSAEAALAAFQSRPDQFDAVITDHMLPGLPGIELASRLFVIRPELPVMLMSGNLSEADERAAREIGIRATLHKPLGLRDMAEHLAAFFVHA
jgi:PAS domain S-box-containing protein